MIGFLKLILCFHVYFMVLNTAECQVTVTNLNGTDTFLCGHKITLECAIPGYVGGMSWQLDGTLIAQCAFGSCTALGALPSGDIFTYDETAKTFNLIIGITHADNGTTYQCDDGTYKENTTVNIQVQPSESTFTTYINEITNTSITVEAGCFYPPDAGKMDVYCVSDTGTEVLVEAAVTMTPTTTGCSGDCAGPNIYSATGNIIIESSNTGGTSAYRFKMYHKDYKQHAISIDSTAKYNCACVCECKLAFPVVVIVCDIVAFILVIFFCWLNKGPFRYKIRCSIAGIAVVICLVLVVSVTICLFADGGKCKSECCSKPCPIAGTVVVWILLACDTAFYIFCVVKYTKDVPNPPTDVGHVEALTTTLSIRITWKPGNNGGLPQTFHIKYKKGSSSTWNYTNVTDTGDEIMNHSITNLAEKTQYDIVIYASNEKGNSTESHVYTALTKAKDVPDPPTDVRHDEVLTTTSSIHITWKPGNNGGLLQTFHIKYKKGSSSTWNYTNVTDTGDEIMNHSITNLAEKTQYDIVIHASNEKGNSTESHVYTALTKEQLEGLSCGFCQVVPSCETKHAREPQHSNQPGKDKFARNGNNDKGRENASRTNAGPRPQPAPPTKDPSF